MFRTSILFVCGVSFLLVSGMATSTDLPELIKLADNSCITAELGIRVNLDFSHNNQSIKTTFNVPVNNTKSSESCDQLDHEQNMTLTWPCDKHPNLNNSLTFHFVKKNTSNEYSVHHLELVFSPMDLNPSQNFTLIHNKEEFITAIDKPFHGEKLNELNLTLGDKIVGQLELHNLTFQAFKTAPVEPVGKKTTTTTSTTTTSTTTTTTTTTSTTPRTTTEPTTTTTPQSNVTTVAPPPFVPPKDNKWIVENKTICIVLQMNAEFQLDFRYNNSIDLKKTIEMPVDNNTMASGACGPLEQNITLSWPHNNNQTANNSMTLHFKRNDTKHQYFLSRVDVNLSASNFVNVSKPLELIHIGEEFTTGMNKSYQCTTPAGLNLMLADNTTKLAGHLKLSKLQFEVFKAENTTGFGAVENCIASEVSDVVPIAVGCILAGLVVVVLIAYLVGRRRRRASQGYASM